MTIYILHEDPVEIPKMLSDKYLEEMIKNIGEIFLSFKYEIPITTKWYKWAEECKNNYQYLLNLLEYCLFEFYDRFNDRLKKFPRPISRVEEIFQWARDNIPDLPDKELHPIPYNKIVPEKYCIYGFKNNKNAILSYQNYYQSKVKNVKNIK